ncbi:MAG: regulator of chromosome condensation 1/beta-lactamase-inhibitor protein II [Benniella sp.]|nr:MAG: regulator of chromosome condensation 1/beta-lactamase-inhibitor protein II [Benniella sp.]
MAQVLGRTASRWTGALRRSLLRSSQFHTSAPQATISVVRWGYGTEGFVHCESEAAEKISVQASGNRYLGAGTSHYLIGLSNENDCSILVGGMNNSGQLGNGTTSEDVTHSSIKPGDFEILALACGREHSMILVKDCKFPSPSVQTSPAVKTALYAFGNSMYGQLGLGVSKDTLSSKSSGSMDSGLVFKASPTKVELSDPSENVIQVQCGLDHTVLLTDQGNLYTMGWGADGQLGLGPESSSDRAVPTLIERLSWKAKGKEVGRIKQISSSTDFTLALTENNQLWIWGNAEYGQCMVNKKIDRILEPMLIPHPISETETIASVAAGGTFGLLLTESGKVYTCGYGALGLGRDKIQVLMPEQITSLSGIRKIVASTDQAAAIDDKGHLYTWGTYGKIGRLVRRNLEDCFTPKRADEVFRERNVTVLDVALGQDGGLALIDYKG